MLANGRRRGQRRWPSGPAWPLSRVDGRRLRLADRRKLRRRRRRSPADPPAGSSAGPSSRAEASASMSAAALRRHAILLDQQRQRLLGGDPAFAGDRPGSGGQPLGIGSGGRRTGQRRPAPVPTSSSSLPASAASTGPMGTVSGIGTRGSIASAARGARLGSGPVTGRRTSAAQQDGEQWDKASHGDRSKGAWMLTQCGPICRGRGLRRSGPSP